MSSRPAVFLDRDGVLNEPVIQEGVPHPPSSLEDLVVMPETVAACRALGAAGLLLIMVTNQPDVARGTATWSEVDRINQELQSRLGLDDVLVCPHDDADGCACRKPEPGLLLEAAARWQVSLGGSVMVGDRWRDVEAGRRAGCATVLVQRNYHERPALGADHVADNLHEAVPWILQRTGSGAAGGIQ
ncbi:MAG: HAD family hydrolase [Acidimicrobiaceae bacterium]|nr:HAD family hydrolase [Acidimicrobiaceae bacterium]